MHFRDSRRNICALVVARWSARLSALLIQGNAAVVRSTQLNIAFPHRAWNDTATVLPHSLPEGECFYELLCGPTNVDSDLD